MKIGRNEPCPCGSGKKYKKCCYLKDGATAQVGNIAVQGKQSDDLEDQEMLAKLLHNMRKITLDEKPHIKEYYRIRKLHGEIVNAMIKYHDDGKFEQKISPDFLSQNEREPVLYLMESEFNFESRVGTQGFYDMLIYKPAPNMNCITEEFIQKNRYRNPDKVEFLHSMLDSKLGLFEITEIDSKDGYAYLRDVFTGDAYKIIDVGLSGDSHYGDFYLYTRVIQYQGVCFGTGLNFVFTKTDPFIKKHIQHHKKDFSPNSEFVRFTQLYNRYSQNPDKIKVIPNTLK